jgi:hypothetical protein
MAQEIELPTLVDEREIGVERNRQNTGHSNSSYRVRRHHLEPQSAPQPAAGAPAAGQGW